MTTVPSSIGGPARLKIFACVMAVSRAVKVCALPAPPPRRVNTRTAPRKFRRRRFTVHLPAPRRLAEALVCLLVSFLLISSRPAFSLRPSSLPVSSRRPFFLPLGSSVLSRGDLSFLFQVLRARRFLFPCQSRRGRRSVFSAPRRRCSSYCACRWPGLR